MVTFGPLTAEIGWPAWGTQANFNGYLIRDTRWNCCSNEANIGFVSYCAGVGQWRSTKLCTVFGRLLGWYTIYIFGGSCP